MNDNALDLAKSESNLPDGIPSPYHLTNYY